VAAIKRDYGTESSACYPANRSTLIIFWGSTILVFLATGRLFYQSSEMAIFFVFVGLFLLLRAIHYSRLKVCIDESGLTLYPANRSIQWPQVVQIVYASRRLRPDGSKLPRQISLQLIIQNQRPLDLPHRFKNMTALFNQVRHYVEPILLDRARKQLQEEGQVSFGKALKLTRDSLLLTRKAKNIPLLEIEKINIWDGSFVILSKDGKVLFSDAVEMIPNAPTLRELFETATAHQPSPVKSNPKRSSPPNTSFADAVERGIECERSRLAGHPYLTVQFTQVYNYDGLDENLQLLDSFADKKSAIRFVEQFSEQTLAESLGPGKYKPGNWQHDRSYDNRRFKPARQSSHVKGVHLKSFRTVSDSGYDSKKVQFEVLNLSSSSSFGPELFNYYDAESEWRYYFRSKG
jgi:hypothetical protein